MSTLGHTIVLFGILNFIIVVNLSTYLKRPTDSKNKGFPFIQSRVAFLTLDKYYASLAILKKQIVGTLNIRKLLNKYLIKEII
jgi:predicted acetyltransferase